ncbi:hypothetical protein [Desulforhopalus singaporensis]|uniref:Uncharacterized protein n=1 Tax=Desulforhopalus singaporensis TaxID=91360 RepID=A0A1H0R177_9BACT|nr:hypothetical protein [Desulforhopalus singaporensis]SDP22919.1 hypothetical protein SAMN05660330_02157 [Desulforhopalus singaporensis]
MRKYTLKTNNISQKQIKKAISLNALVVKFTDKTGRDYYNRQMVIIRNKVINEIMRVYRENNDQLESLREQRKNQDEDNNITYIVRCIELGKMIDKKFINHKPISDHVDHIIPVLLKSYKSNRLLWVIRDKTYYYKKNISRYYHFIFDIRVLCVCLDALQRLGYIDKIKHKAGTKRHKGYCTRYILTGLKGVFENIQSKYSFKDENHKEIVILKDEVERWFCEKDKNGNVNRYKKTYKKLIGYEDNDFTNRLRSDLQCLNNFYSKRRIEVHAKNIMLPVSFIIKLLESIISSRIEIKKLELEDREWGSDENYINIVREEIDNKFIISSNNLLDNKYISILSKEIAHNKNLDLSEVGEKYFFVKEIYFEILSKSLRAIFNRGSFENGGRTYGMEWISLPKVLRKHIYIDGKPTIGLDFKGLHIFLAYHMMGKECPHSDPYEIDGYSRDEVKLSSLIAINAPNPKSAIHGTINKIKKVLNLDIDEDYAEQLINKMREHHRLIEEFWCNDSGVSFQNVDSSVMRHALLALMDQGICGLGIHDEIIVTRDNAYKTMKQMITSYRLESRTNGFEPTVTVG